MLEQDPHSGRIGEGGTGSVHHGLIVQPTYRMQGGKPVVQLYGRLVDGRAFLVEDDRFRPYFFVPTRDAALLPNDADIEIRPTPLRTLAGEPVTRITLAEPSAVRPLRERLLGEGVVSYEADLRFGYRYLMDQAVRAAVAIDGPISNPDGPLVRFRNPILTPSDQIASLTWLSLDLETTPDASEIISAALVGCGTEEVLLVSPKHVRGAQCYGDERALLVALAKRIRELDPDLLIGWNVVDFDVRVIVARMLACRITGREADLGRTGGRTDVQSDIGYTRQARASMPGRIVLDGLPLVRDAIKLPDYRLQTVAEAVLGRGKLINEAVPDAAAEISRLYREEPEALVAYNLEDARLVPDILEHEGLLALTRERNLLTGMQQDRVSASIASFDLVYLPELRRHGYVAPSVDTTRSHGRVTGGAVLSPTAGLSERVAVYDFKSLYPSLIRTFNIDPLALALGSREPPGAAIVAPNGAHLSRAEAILPRVLERFMDRRQAAKDRGDRHADQAIKIMMNSMFGIFAAPACRFFSPELANAITHFGQQTLAWTCACFEDEGVRVLYGDTDSVFVALPEAASRAELSAHAESMRSRIAKRLEARIRQEYDVEARLELELEKVFSRFFLPRVRGGKEGSKKRYAGWIEDAEGVGRLEVVGLEAVRRDWPAIAGRLQTGMLERLFRDEPVLPFVIEMIERVQSGEADDELVYVKRLRKGSIEGYTASSPPHVQAARKLEARLNAPVGRVVRYVQTLAGPEAFTHEEPIPEAIDRRHYIERILRPVAQTILDELDLEFGEALGEPRQLKLL
jgi:DNA polymerase-2